jgi:hypothetical protein
VDYVAELRHLKVTAVWRHGLETGLLKLFCDVICGEVETFRGRAPAFEFV